MGSEERRTRRSVSDPRAGIFTLNLCLSNLMQRLLIDMCRTLACASVSGVSRNTPRSPWRRGGDRWMSRWEKNRARGKGKFIGWGVWEFAARRNLSKRRVCKRRVGGSIKSRMERLVKVISHNKSWGYERPVQKLNLQGQKKA